MRKKLIVLLLTLAMCLGLMPTAALAAETNLPDWYFLFAIFKNVDADGVDRDGKAVHLKYSMTQDEVNIARDNAEDFEEYMNSLGVIRAHVEVLELDETVTELKESEYGSYIGAEQTAPLLERKVDLDRYDHVTCITCLGISMKYGGITSSDFENGTGHSCINLIDRENVLKNYVPSDGVWPPSAYVHEFLHFVERLDGRWGAEFRLHLIGDRIYAQNHENYTWKTDYTDIILNRVKGDAETGTGVAPAVWQYPPHVLRTMTELTIPSGVTGLGHDAFVGYTNLTSVTIPSGVTYLGVSAFNGCTNLANVTLPSSLTKIEPWAFQGCSALTRISIPASVTSIGEVAFQKAGLKDVYYAGTEAQWEAIAIGDYNSPLTRANIHYNYLMADVKTTDWFAKPVTWAVEQGVASGTGEGNFSPNSTCTQGQILTFLWRANGSPEPSGTVSGSEYYAVPLQWAKEQKLVDGSLSAKDPCTRADVVTYLWKLAGSPTAKAASFSDVPSGAAYAPAVSWAVEKGVTSGTSETTFSPEKTCTRGQIVTFLYAALGK